MTFAVRLAGPSPGGPLLLYAWGMRGGRRFGHVVRGYVVRRGAFAPPDRRRTAPWRLRRLQVRAEEEDLDGRVGGNRRVAGDDGKAVGGDHGAEDARALGAGEAGPVPVIGRGEGHAKVASPPVRIADRLLGAGGDDGPVQTAVARHAQDGRPHEELEGYHRGDRVAGQREGRDRALAVLRDGRERDRLAGAHVDQPEVLLGAQTGERFLVEGVLPHRDAGGGDQDVAAEPPAEARLDLGEAVSRDAEPDRHP